MSRFATALLVALVFCPCPAAARSRPGLISFQSISIPPDVPAHLCSAMTQDRQGFIWFGTQGGLVRYDGYDFRLFRSLADDGSTLGGNYVRTLLVARDGRVWAGSFTGGLSVFDPRTETFSRLRHDPGDPRSIAYDRVEGLAETPDGSIWIATSAGLDRLDPHSGAIRHFRHDAADPSSLADDRVRGLLVDRHQRLWVGTRDGLQRWNAADDTFEHVALRGQYVVRLFEDSRGRIWLGTEEHGAAVLDPEEGTIRRLSPHSGGNGGLSHYWVYGFAEPVKGEVWVATFGGGIDVVDAATFRILDRLRPDPVDDGAIPDDRIGAIMRDRSGVIWVGTWGEGIVRHDPRSRPFRSLRFSPNRPEGLTHRAVVRALGLRDGTIWAGTNGNGIDIFDRDLVRIGAHRPAPGDPGALSDGSITALAEAGDGTVWVATLNSALHRHPGKGARFERVPQERLPGGPIRTMAFTPDGALWVGAAEGMARIDPATLETRVFRDWPGAAAGSSPAIESIVVERNGLLWVGTDNGLYRFDPRTSHSLHIRRDPGRRDALPDNWVPDLLLARDGRLWVGTAGGAAVLTRLDGPVARFRAVSSSSADSLIEDGEGNIWLTPRQRIDPETLASRTLGAADGIAFRTFFIASRARTSDGRLLFGSPEGLLVVDPAAIGEEPREGGLMPVSLHIDGERRVGAPLLEKLTLLPRETEFSLDVASSDFVSYPHRYRYRLEGLDDRWSETGPSQRTIAYSRLPPGRFTLRVTGLRTDGSPHSREMRLPVEVLPAFHQTLWFKLLSLLVAAALVYLAYRLRVRHLQAQQRILESLVAERTEELTVAYARIEEASLTDPLTGLRNRRYLEQTIAADLQMALRTDDLIVLLVDLDHFKSVNDTHGHAAGDAVLAQLAGLLRTSVRSSDVVVRWGGEEFLIVVRFVDRSHAPAIAEKIRSAVESQDFVLPDGSLLRRTCSIGVAAWPVSRVEQREASFERVVDLADEALYEAKRRGRNRWIAAAMVAA